VGMLVAVYPSHSDTRMCLAPTNQVRTPPKTRRHFQNCPLLLLAFLPSQIRNPINRNIDPVRR